MHGSGDQEIGRVQELKRCVQVNPMRDRLSMAALFACVFLLGAVVSTDVANGTVKGSVQRPGGQPLAGVNVIIGISSNSSYSVTAQTNADGAFTFPDTPLGEFEVKAYDGDDRLLAASKGILEKPDEVVTLLLQVKP
jgi:hypothetical protein